MHGGQCQQWNEWSYKSCNHVDYCVEQLQVDALAKFITEKARKGLKEVAIGQVGRHVALLLVNSKLCRDMVVVRKDNLLRLAIVRTRLLRFSKKRF
ncbi:hypothetical protein PR002_g20660 [Phytophthora rubi]|uniref:Uncharacterized protein n=1 Tax=Phytophthora rubi TaxID=129364 RepID=A0A6A3JEK1_9STRA|nr:hypothetical protein PR002_g20660 [Phytophthora rubi]